MNEDIKNQLENDHIVKGVLGVCTAFFLFTLMQALAKLLTDTHHVVEIAFWRNTIAVIPFGLYILVSRRPDLLKTNMPVPLFFRVLVGTIGLILTFAAAQALPLANATVLFFASTLITPVFAHFFLKERVGWHRWSAVLIGMCGVLLVARPGPDMTVIGIILALSAAVTHATIQSLLRYLKSENSFTITFYFILGGVILPGLAMPWFFTMPNPETWVVLIGIGIAGALGQYCLTIGFKYAQASLLSPLNYTGLIWATLFDVMIWKYMPGVTVFLGGVIIIAANFYILYRERRAQQLVS